MNRRQFIQMTVVLAAAAPFARALALDDPAPRLGAVWVPTQEEVDQWLEYYKAFVRSGCTEFADVLRALFANEPHGLGENLAELEQAERAFASLEADRKRVAFSQGSGYAVGREGGPRYTVAYTGPSNEGFGWYNAWVQGNLDYRRSQGERIAMPRSPGVTWPEGKTIKGHRIMPT